MNARRDARSILDAAGRGDLDGAIESVFLLPPDHPGRSSVAASLAMALVQQTAATDLRRFRRLGDLLDIADADPPPWPNWPKLRANARIMSLMASVADNMATPEDAVRRLADLEPDLGDSPAERMLLDSARTMMTFVRSFQAGDETAHTLVQPQVDRLREFAAVDPRTAPIADFMADAMEVQAIHSRGGDAAAAMDRLREKAALLPPELEMSRVMDETVAMMGPFRRSLSGSPFDAGDSTPPSPEQLAAIEHLTGSADGALDPVLSHTAAGGALLNNWEETDLDKIDAAIGHFQAALDLLPPGSPRRAFALASLVVGLVRRTELTNDMTGLATVVSAAEEARTLLGGPHHPQWQLVNEMLGYAQHRLGDPDISKFTFESLRSIAWQVLLQRDVASAGRIARDAADSAVSAAVHCCAVGHVGDAVRSLDAGRGLMLFAATTLRDVVPGLLAADRPDLAERWEQAGGIDAKIGVEQDPTGLRAEVLTVLADGSGLLDPPSTAEIREALTILDADALVYLAPHDAFGGMAVIAPATGPAGYLALPNLVVDKDVDVERYLRALAYRGAGPEPGEPRDATRDMSWVEAGDEDLAGSLDKLCDWAWRAAVGPLIESYLDSLPEPASGRPRRMYLVPMGELALIPWQAARRRDGTYAVELAAISQTASARMLCRSAALAPVPAAPVGLIVGDPDTDGTAPALLEARAEAYAVYQSFYRGGRYVGTRPDGTAARSGAGTGDEVRAWLTTNRPGAGAMLHLACHGVIKVDEATATAYLLLAGGGKVTAEEIVQLMAVAPERAVGLVVLAACRTGRSIYGYDEAFSLGTAFLAGGARSVLSTQWAVPDGDTSVLMFMFHHYLMVHGLPAWAALREAQLWMLKPAAVPPQTMPAPLRRQLDGMDPNTDRIAAWAGFVHWGQ